jgi:hypothetical protein
MALSFKSHTVSSLENLKEKLLLKSLSFQGFCNNRNFGFEVAMCNVAELVNFLGLPLQQFSFEKSPALAPAPTPKCCKKNIGFVSSFSSGSVLPL